MFLLFCAQGKLKAPQYFFPVLHPREVLSQYFLSAYPLIHPSDPVPPLCCQGISGQQRTHKNRWSLPSLWCLIQQKALETPEQLLQSRNRG